MFERELIDMCFVKRWGIVRTLIPQSVAGHSYLVCAYANDICVFLDVPHLLHLKVLQRAIFHDIDEIFTGDLPGPNKRGLLDAMGPEAKGKWKAKLAEWSGRVFSNLAKREGANPGKRWDHVVELILKTADWLEAATRMATETQMGNRCSERHIVPNRNGAFETAQKLIVAVGVSEQVGEELIGKIKMAVYQAEHGASLGPWITKEDDDDRA